MIQQRLTDRLIKYWEMLIKEGDIPESPHFNKAAIADIWDNCILMKMQPSVEGRPILFQFTDVGNKAASLFAKDPVGQYYTSGTRVIPAARILQRIPDMLKQRAPMMDEGQFVTERNKIVKYRSCLLPLATRQKISHIVIGLSWSEF